MTAQDVYVFTHYYYDGVTDMIIIYAHDDADCADKMIANYERFEPFFQENLGTEWCHGGLFKYLQLQQRLANPHEIPSPDTENEELSKAWESWQEGITDNPARVRELVEANRNSLMHWIDAYCKDSGMSINIIEPTEVIS